MPGRSFIKGQVGGSLDNLIMLNSVQLFMPFTDSLFDQSIYSRTVTNVGGSINQDGLALSTNGYITTSDTTLVNLFNKSSKTPFTFEAIIKLTDTRSFVSLITTNSASNGAIYCYIQNKRLVFRNTGSGNFIDVQFDFVNVPKHIALVFDGINTVLFIDGVKVGQTTNLPTSYASILYLFGAPAQAYQVNIVEGAKVTSKALESYQFSLLRPMQLKYPTFKIGAREYVYKDGVWNPNFNKLSSGGVTFETNAIRLLNGQIFIDNSTIPNGSKLFVEFKPINAITTNGITLGEVTGLSGTWLTAPAVYISNGYPLPNFIAFAIKREIVSAKGIQVQTYSGQSILISSIWIE